MNRLPLLVISLLLLALPASAAQQIQLTQAAEDYSLELLSSDINSSVVRMELNSFELDDVNIDGQTWSNVSLPGRATWMEVGMPALPTLRQSIVIPDDAEMRVTVLASDYRDFSGIDVAPSKGHILRSVDPATVAYSFADFYSQDAWFPGELSDLGDPYIMRDVRGQVLEINPFSYNPTTSTLRVYTSVTVRVEAVGPGKVNVLTQRPAARDAEFEQVFARHFLNYDGDLDRYVSVSEIGNMLIITYDAYRSAMEPYAAWKNQMGIPTDLVDLSDIGSTATQIKAYIQNLYDTVGITFVLLVGDVAQIPYFNNGGASDPSYVLLAGGDNYPDAFIGRFSAENLTQVQTQVERSITYERDAGAGDWFSKGYGIASDDGTGGDDGELDWEHLDNIRDDFLAFTYDWVGQNYEPSANISAAVAAVNAGLSVINYTGHGYLSGWSTTGFSNTHVNALTNDNMLPFIISVACNTGEFQSGTCFGEAWLRATNAGVPTGAIGFYGSTISQSWNPPMCAQDEIADLLVQEEKRTYGALCFLGSCQMMDEYGATGETEYKMWTIFGDPSLRVRTASPTAMAIDHLESIDPLMDYFEVDAPAGALCALSFDGELIGSAFADAGGTAAIPLSDALPTPGNEATLTVSGFNRLTAVELILVGDGLAPTCDVTPSEFVTNMMLDTQVSDYLYISNNGEVGSTLYYDITVSDPNFPRSIAGSTLVLDVAEYLPGSTLDVVWTCTCVSNDSEWIKSVEFDLPVGVVLNSATSMDGGSSGPMPYSGVTGDGIAGDWSGTGTWGNIYPNESASATTSLTFSGITGDVVIPYTMYGDIYGSEPHTLSGELLITMSGPNVNVDYPNGGEMLEVDDRIDILYTAAGGPETVCIELMRGFGFPTELLAEGLPAALGSFSWTVTAPITAEARIRITDEGDPGVTDLSDGMFTIYRPLTWVTLAQTEGSVAQGGTATIQVTFDSNGLPEDTYEAEILISSNAGADVLVPVTLFVTNSGTGVDTAPAALALTQNHPNPFNPTTRISFALPAAGDVRLTVFDIQGKAVKTLIDAQLPIGRHHVIWDGKSDAGSPMASGIYFYRLDTVEKSLSQKMMLLK